jgi:hypothetical protein
MKKHKSYYLNFVKNIFSQNGEDESKLLSGEKLL